MNDKKAAQQGAGWQENPIPPKPVKHVSPVKIDLRDAGVEYQDGKIVAITGTLAIIPNTPQQHGPLSLFFKSGDVECHLEDNHTGNSLSVKFALVNFPKAVAPTPDPADLHPDGPSADDLDKVANDKLLTAQTMDGFQAAVQFVMKKHGYPEGAAKAVVAEFGVADILNDMKLEAIQDEFKNKPPDESPT